mmetsp:Transcript_29708/g.68794  ORF Transcript_29708/g.68794 Transcript_29708/m.68794 type:complete len:110 (-) Transcript_29708:70-399(-)
MFHFGCVQAVHHLRLKIPTGAMNRNLATLSSLQLLQPAAECRGPAHWVFVAWLRWQFRQRRYMEFLGIRTTLIACVLCLPLAQQLPALKPEDVRSWQLAGMPLAQEVKS